MLWPTIIFIVWWRSYKSWLPICDPAPLNEALWGEFSKIFNSAQLLQYINKISTHFNAKLITLWYSYHMLQHAEHWYVIRQHSKQFCRDFGSQPITDCILCATLSGGSRRGAWGCRPQMPVCHDFIKHDDEQFWLYFISYFVSRWILP